MEKELKKQSRFFYGGKNELLQLLCVFSDYTVCNNYSEISPYYPCIYFGHEWRPIDDKTIFFIISEKRPGDFFVYVSKSYLETQLAEFFCCSPPTQNIEPSLSFIYKYSIVPRLDVVSQAVYEEEDPMMQILSHSRSGQYIKNPSSRTMWLAFVKRTKYSFLKTGNKTLGNYIALVKKLFRGYILEI